MAHDRHGESRMKKPFQILIVSFVIACSTAAVAALAPYTDGYELDSQQVRMPAHLTGHVVIRMCAECEPIVHRVNRNTQYIITGQGVVTLDKFKSEIRRGEMSFVYVGYYIDSGIASRITLAP